MFMINIIIFSYFIFGIFPIDLHFKCKILLNRNREIWYVLIYRMHKDINVFFFFQTRITQLFDLSIYSSRLWGFFSRDHVWLEWVSRVATSASYLPNKINPPPSREIVNFLLSFFGQSLWKGLKFQKGG